MVIILHGHTVKLTTINFLSNHPIEQKMAAFRFHITRMYSLPLNPDKKQTEWEITQSVAKNNNIAQHLLLNLNQKILHKVNNKKKPARMTKKSGLHLPSTVQRSEKLPICSKI